MGIKDILRGLKEDKKTIREAKKKGIIKREYEYSKTHGTKKQKLAATILYFATKSKKSKKPKRKITKKRQ
jgi:hypothetical protein